MPDHHRDVVTNNQHVKGKHEVHFECPTVLIVVFGDLESPQQAPGLHAAR